MRLIGYLANENAARTFGDFLFVQGIDNRIEHQPEEGWGIWVNDEDRLQEASQRLAEFRANPSDPQYRNQAKGAAELRAQREQSEAAYRNKLRNRRHLFRPLTAYGFGPLTFVLIATCIAISILSNLGSNRQAIMGLFITDFSQSDFYVGWDTSLPEIRHGEVWRLVSPMLIHFGVLHILFNMLWLRDLGSMIEGRQSSVHLALLVLAFSAGSNLAQFYFGNLFNLYYLPDVGRLLKLYATPSFGGMSGVVYGLLGYIWLRGKFDPGSGLYLHSSTVTMMLIWLVACSAGLLGQIANIQIANTAHVAGLGMGMAWGYLSSLRHR